MRVLILSLISISAWSQSLTGIIGDVHHGSGTVATPGDLPGAGTYGSTQSVTLSDATAGATICYTTDGSTPGASTPGTCNSSPTTTYSTAISVASTTTIKAIGTKAGLTNSGVLTSLYTISASSPVVTSVTLTGSLRNDFAGDLGFIFTVGGSSLTITDVGRYCVGGNSASHTVKLVNASSGSCTTDIGGGSASVNMSGCTDGTFVYTSLGSPVTLTSGTQYCIVSSETNGGDQWSSVVTAASVISVDNGGVFYNGSWTNAMNGANYSYSGPNMKH